MEQLRAAQTRTEQTLRQAIRAGIREARAERQKRRELDDKLTQLAAAQLLTEEALQTYLRSLRPGGNGGQSPN